MTPRLLLDEDIQAGLAEALRRRGLDAVHLQELKRKGLADAAVLTLAAEQGRCLVSYNIRDFVLLHNAYAAEGRPHPGILLGAQRPMSALLRALLHYLADRSAGDLANRIGFL